MARIRQVDESSIHLGICSIRHWQGCIESLEPFDAIFRYIMTS